MKSCLILRIWSLIKRREDMVFEFLITPHEQENESAGDYEG